MDRSTFCPLAAALFVVIFFVPKAQGQLFEADSKRFSAAKMDILVKEIERRERSSVIQIDIRSVGSSVGSSFFLLCSLRQLALERGGFRHIVKIEEYPKHGQMLIGFLLSADEDPARLGPEFRALSERAAVIGLEQFAEICSQMK